MDDDDIDDLFCQVDMKRRVCLFGHGCETDLVAMYDEDGDLVDDIKKASIAVTKVYIDTPDADFVVDLDLYRERAARTRH